MRLLNVRCIGAVSAALVALVALGAEARAGVVITSGNGAYQVGIDTLGNLYDPTSGIGFRRVADGYDPIAPGIPREAYGIATDTDSGYVDPFFTGVSANMVLVSSVFGANSGTIVTDLVDLLNNVPLLRLEQVYSFVAGPQNVLRIDSFLTNLTGAVIENMLYSRNVDWDIDPWPFNELITAGPRGALVADTSYYGFENADPFVPFIFPAAAAGAVYGPNDLGAGILVNFGRVAAGDSRSFSVFHAINQLGQTEAQLRAQLGGANGHNWENAAALGFDFGAFSPNPSTLMSGVSVPEPSSVVLAGLGLIGGVAVARSRRRA